MNSDDSMSNRIPFCSETYSSNYTSTSPSISLAKAIDAYSYCTNDNNEDKSSSRPDIERVSLVNYKYSSI